MLKKLWENGGWKSLLGVTMIIPTLRETNHGICSDFPVMHCQQIGSFLITRI